MNGENHQDNIIYIDEKSFKELFQQYYTVCKDYARFYTNDAQIAEDIVQDVFLKMWQNRETLNIETSSKGYLIRSIHNACIQFLRHQKITERYSEEQRYKLEESILMNRLFFEDGLSKLFQSDINEIVNQSIAKLPVKTRTIFRLSRNEFKKNSVIALEMDLSEKSVEYHISKALESLRINLKDYLPLMIFITLQASKYQA
jgi:RNA polymerase sigma-70 factor (ECF subfamily)